MTAIDNSRVGASTTPTGCAHLLDPVPVGDISPGELEDLCRRLMAVGRYAEQRCGLEAALSFFATAAIAESMAQGELS